MYINKNPVHLKMYLECFLKLSTFYHKNGAPHEDPHEEIAVHIMSFARSGSLFQM